MDDIHRNIQEYNSNKEQKTNFFDDLIADILSNKNLIQY